MNAIAPIVKSPVAPLTLEDRIAAALQEHAAADAIASLIQEAKDAVASSEQAYARAKAKALDPITPAADVAKARRAMEDCEFRQERMRQADLSLRAELAVARERERSEQRRILVDEIVAERDEIAAELVKYYGPAAELIARLLARCQANDSRIASLGAADIYPAECVARGVSPTFYGPQGMIHRLATSTRLPTFDANTNYVWPR